MQEARDFWVWAQKPQFGSHQHKCWSRGWGWEHPCRPCRGSGKWHQDIICMGSNLKPLKLSSRIQSGTYNYPRYFRLRKLNIENWLQRCEEGKKGKRKKESGWRYKSGEGCLESEVAIAPWAGIHVYTYCFPGRDSVIVGSGSTEKVPSPSRLDHWEGSSSAQEAGVQNHPFLL